MRRHRPPIAVLVAASTLGLAGAGGEARAAERTEVVRREIAIARDVHRVVIDNVFGSVRVRAGADGKVTLEIQQRASSRHASALDDAFREVTLEVSTAGGRLELVQDGPFRCGDRCCAWRSGCRWDPDYEVSWEWEVVVPPGVDLEASTVNGGALDIAGVGGRVDASNVNGPLRLAGLAGEVTASTVNGDLEAEFARSPSDASSFTTVNGDVELALPSGTSADLGFETMHGDVYTDFEVTALPVRAVAERAGGGGRRYRFERDGVVRIGRGGVRLDCETVNGDIVVRAR
jgi:hypothetical protein